MTSKHTKDERELTVLQQQFVEVVISGVPFVLIRSEEPSEVEHALASVCEGKHYCWDLSSWDCDAGLQARDDGPNEVGTRPASATAPVEAKLRGSAALLAALDVFQKRDNRDNDRDATGDDPRQPFVMMIRNMHRFWRGEGNDPVMIIQKVQNIIPPCKLQAKCLIGLVPPGEMPPPELLPLVKIIDHTLPAEVEFLDILAGVSADIDADLVTTDEGDALAIAEASCGLTRFQAENAYAVANSRLVTATNVEVTKSRQEGRKVVQVARGPFFCSVIEEEKNKVLNADGMLKRWDGSESFDDVGGNDAVKEYLTRIMRHEARRKRSKMNCLLLVGPPGTGKTLIAKALGNYTGRKTYGGNLSSNKGKWVGESEQNTRRMFARASAMNKIVLYFDEINEQVEGGESDGHSVDRSIRQYLMEWLDTHRVTDDVMVVMTANDISKMHMAMTRAGRVDMIYYVGLPRKEQKQAIWAIQIAKYGLSEQQTAELPDDQGWAGVEIAQCCQYADNLDYTLVEAAKKHVIPKSISSKETIIALAEWAEGRCFDAETGERYRRDARPANETEATGGLDGYARVRRKVRRL